MTESQGATPGDPVVFDILRGDAIEVVRSAYGSVGRLVEVECLEAVWVSKQDEDVDPEWFSQDRVDLILVVKGELRFEFERQDLAPRVLGPGQMMILPAHTRCRAYRWPRERREASVFVAVYPSHRQAGRGGNPRSS